MKRLLLVLGLALLLSFGQLAASAPVASSAIGQIGQTYATGDYAYCGTGSWDVQEPGPAGASYVVPSGDWLITSWSTYSDGLFGASRMSMIVFRPATTGYTIVGESEIEDLSATPGLNTFTLATGIPVQEGDVLGLWAADNAACRAFTGDYSDYVRVGGVGSGPPAVDAAVTPTASLAPYALNISATLTPGVTDQTPPQVSDVRVSPNPALVDTSSTLTATIDDATTGDSNIGGAEYSIDGGTWVSMEASDGSFGSSPTLDVTATLPGESTPGTYTVCVRGSDTAGNTSDGSAACTDFSVPSAEQLIATLQTDIAGMDLKKGTVSALNGPLKEATNALAAGSTADAVGAMNDFLGYVNAQTGKKLSTDEAAALTSAAEDIVYTLDNS